MTRKSGRARLGDVELAFDLDGSGPRLVWCHGLASCRAGDRDVIDGLARHFTVLAFDARGHGDSSPVTDPTAYTYAALADDLAGLLDHAGWNGAVLAGASMGAGAACRLAIEEPSRATALIMARPGSAGGPASERLQTLFRLGAEAIRAGGIEAALAFLLTIPEARAQLEDDPARIEGLRREWSRHDPESIAAALIGIPAAGPLDGGLDPARVTAPTLVIPGNDPIHPTEAGLACARLIPGASCAPPFDSQTRADETRHFVELVVGFIGNRGP
jgi:pimeloyl-ACP methyl ester carboxylesterase